MRKVFVLLAIAVLLAVPSVYAQPLEHTPIVEQASYPDVTMNSTLWIPEGGNSIYLAGLRGVRIRVWHA